jgi:transcriptional regulator with XRE-family HTH domain
MPKDPSKSAFKQRFTERVRWARIARDLTQEEIAELLSITQDKYKHYEGSRTVEGRSYLPHDLVPKFCLATGVDAAWLFTEKGRAPVLGEPPAEPARAPRKKIRTRRAA